MFEQLIDEAKLALNKARNVWSQVKGPATAVVATAARIGWEFTAAHLVTTDIGAVIKLRVDPPKVVAELVYDAVKRWRWKRVEAKFPYLASSGAGRGANLAPLWKLLRSKSKADSWHAGHRGALRSAAAGRPWTQTRCKAAGFVKHNRGLLCLDDVIMQRLPHLTGYSLGTNGF